MRISDWSSDVCSSDLIGQQAYGEAALHRVQSGGTHAVVGRDAAHVHLGDALCAQPRGQVLVVAVLALEAGVGRFVFALEEDRVEGLRVEVGVEGLTIGAHLAVHWPGLLVVRLGAAGCPVRTRVDVVVLGGHHVRPLGASAALLDHAWSSAPTSCATCAPPATASDPPSQKSFWTSTTISARVMSPP